MSVISKETKTAIILFNLGGPDNPESVRPFLFNLFNDPAIITLPNPIRYMVASIISSRRAPVAVKIYEHIGGKSPLLDQTNAQAMALRKALSEHGKVKIFPCMRYWHPMSEEVVTEVKEYEPDHIILLPLYPQCSTTTTLSSFKDWDKQAEKQKLDIPTSKICCYPMDSGLLSAHADSLRNTYFEASKFAAPRVLFSAHGLPKKTIESGDPYQWQVEQTVETLVKIMGQTLDYVTCYQSRVGPLEWIGPSTEDEIIRAGKDGVPVIIVPIAFVSEHSETLVELDIEYKELAEQHGITAYYRVPAITEHPEFIKGLAEVCLNIQSDNHLCSSEKKRLCPTSFTQCPCAA